MSFLVQTYREAFRGLPRTVWLAALVAFLNRAGTMVFPFLGLWLVERRGFPRVTVGVLLAAWGAGSIFGTWLGGWLADRWGPRRVLGRALLGTALGFLCLPLITDPALLGLAFFLVAALGDAFRPAIMTYLTVAAPAGLVTRANALLRLFINVGMTIGPAVGGFLAAVDFVWIFVVDAATCLAAAWLCFAGLPELVRAERRGGARVEGISPWRDRAALGLFGVSFLFALAFFQVFATWPLYLNEVLGVSKPKIGLLFAVNGVFVVAVEMALVQALSGLRQVRVVGVGCVVACLGFGATSLAHSETILVATVLVWSLGEMLTMPTISGLVMQRAPAGREGQWMGAYGLNWALALLLAPIVGTVVWSNFGPHALWYAIALAGPLLWLLCLALDRVWDRGAGPGHHAGE